MIRFAITALLLISLAGCQSEKQVPVAGTEGAAGELLEGSISDAMLPLDTVRSQAPAAAARADAPVEVDGQQPVIRRQDSLLPKATSPDAAVSEAPLTEPQLTPVEAQ